MRAAPGLDPPEYLDWREDAQVLREFEKTLDRYAARVSILEALPAARRLRLYEGLVRNRLHDQQLKRWVRSGVLSKAWLGTGEEAVTVGACHALGDEDVVGPMIRNAGACHERGIPLVTMFRGALGTADGPAAGKDLHFGDLERGVVAPISMVGSLVGVCGGMALAFRLRGEPRVALTWVGDGTIGTAGFHEGLTSAVALKAPLVVVIQNNRIALGTPAPWALDGPPPEDSSLPDGLSRFAALGSAYGVPLFPADGNNVLDVFAATTLAREAALGGSHPALVLADTFRMGGHATHDEGESRRILPAALFEHYGKRDPVRVFRAFLRSGSVGGGARAGQPPVPPVAEAELEAIEARVEKEVSRAEAEALRSREFSRHDPGSAASGVFAETR